MGVGLVPIKKHTELTDKEVAGVIDHADGSVDLLTKGTYVPVNKAGDTMTGNLVPDPTDAHDFGLCGEAVEEPASRWGCILGQHHPRKNNYTLVQPIVFAPILVHFVYQEY
ncbi:unnamed protein product [marine sediment metagenome]|uniref:Uncharacterized protein n=1 Tax=marine sediment metagenome TaxID=412755 RepID=X1NGN6_9ZZZZ